MLDNRNADGEQTLLSAWSDEPEGRQQCLLSITVLYEQ